jgi:tetraacyldisaccharide 4'-kinase
VKRAIEEAWQRDGFSAAALAPLSWLFGAAVGARNLAYDLGAFRQYALGLPSVSVGNLTVGGTGKTPVSAWVAQRFLERGLRPAILLRGYGDDEPLVHERLTPGALVIPDRDRVSAAVRAKAGGAQVLILDDAFQHRRARRDLDLVLVAAEQGAARRLLPAGPLREGPGALRRAQGLIVTRKSASLEHAEQVATAWGEGRLPTAIIHLTPGDLRPGGVPLDADRPGASLASVAGQRVLAVSAIGVPAAFEEQLRRAGAAVTPARFPDHHAFTDAELADLVRRGEGVDRVVCTLKDAVKLGGRWPANAPAFWYLSQAVTVERGERVLADLLDRLASVDTR